MFSARAQEYYEASVQDAPEEVRRFASFFRKTTGQVPLRFAEDFCGSFWLGSEWVRLGPRHEAWGTDLDADTLRWGRERHLARLSTEQRARAHLRRGNVLTTKHPRADLIYAGNFSYCVFRERSLLLRYFKRCRERLARPGVLVLDHMGGPALATPQVERRRCRLPSGERFTYVWEQRSYSHVTHHADFAIHFELDGKRPLRNAFVYEWRLWSLPELRDLLQEAGFDRTDVYWEYDSGDYRRTEYGEDDTLSSVSYLVASVGARRK